MQVFTWRVVDTGKVKELKETLEILREEDLIWSVFGLIFSVRRSIIDVMNKCSFIDIHHHRSQWRWSLITYHIDFTVWGQWLDKLVRPSTVFYCFYTDMTTIMMVMLYSVTRPSRPDIDGETGWDSSGLVGGYLHI